MSPLTKLIILNTFHQLFVPSTEVLIQIYEVDHLKYFYHMHEKFDCNDK